MKTTRLLSLLLLLALLLTLAPAPTARAEDAAAAYRPVLDALRAALADPDADPFAHEDAFSYLFFMSYAQAEPGALLADLNGDGVPELLLGDRSSAATQYGPAYFYDLYTLVDGAPRHVISSGERYRHYLRADGLIAYQGSGGAAYSYVSLYRFNGYDLTSLTELSTDENGWYYAEGGSDQRQSVEPATWRACSDALCSGLISPLPLTPLEQDPALLELSVDAHPEDAAFASLLADYAAAAADPASFTEAAYPLVSPSLVRELLQLDDGVDRVLTAQHRDLNGDGTEELIISAAALEDYGIVGEQLPYEVYAWAEGRVTPLFGLGIGPYGPTLTLCADGCLAVFHSDDSAEVYTLPAGAGALKELARYTATQDPQRGNLLYLAEDGSVLSGWDFFALYGLDSPHGTRLN